MMRRLSVVTVLMPLIGGAGWAQDVPDLKGTWAEVGDGGNVVRQGGPFEHTDPAGNEPVFGDTRTWTLDVTRQEGAMFSGSWKSEVRTDPIVGVVSADGKTLYMADDNGAIMGTLRAANEMEICRALADATRMLAACRIFARAP